MTPPPQNNGGLKDEQNNNTLIGHFQKNENEGVIVVHRNELFRVMRQEY